MKASDLQMNIKVKTKRYFYFKLNVLSFLSNWFDVSQWHFNFIEDIQDNFSRYFKVYAEPSKIDRKEGGEPNL